MADKRTRVMLANLLKNGELYAAHQKYRTTAARLLKTPAPSSFGTGKPKDPAAVALPYDDAAKSAADLLYEGARALLEKGELGGGTDLTLYLLDVWTSREVACTEDTRNKIQTLIALSGGRGTWRKSIIDHATSWTASHSDSPAGDSGLHAYIAQVLYKERDYVGAEQHFLAAGTRDSAKSLASVLFDWYKTDSSTTTTSSTLGRYAARGVLSFLEAPSILCATIFLETFLSLATSADSNLLFERISLSTWPEKDREHELFVTKLASINFLQLVIKSCQIGPGEHQIRRPGNSAGMQTVAPGKTAWTQMLSRYEKEVPWLREQEVKESLSILGELYFGIKPANAGGSNMFGDIMSSLFGGPAPSSTSSRGGRGRGRGRGQAQIGAAGLD